jgi:chromosome segregation protein
MFLEQVIINGFRSYAIETEMSFNPGIGVVIGNNGVGKSNILDAIAWAFGENDLERLRCYGTNDLFFSGSRDYRPAEAVIAVLVLSEGTDAKDGRFRLERRLAKSGEETYLYDGACCDRLQYVQRLGSLGLSDTLKTLVRQEQLNDWLRLDPVQRLNEAVSCLGRGPADIDVESFIKGWNLDCTRYFTTLLPEGDCRLFLCNHNGRTGLEVEVFFPDKGARKSKLISGGERTVTSLAAKLALFDQMQSPLYLLDEVEPALDYVNHKRMQDLLKGLAERKQVIMITHLRSTVELANTLHGVRTRRDGSSFMKFYFVMDKRLLRLYKCC